LLLVFSIKLLKLCSWVTKNLWPTTNNRFSRTQHKSALFISVNHSG